MLKFKSAKEIKVAVVGYGGAFNMGKAHFDQCVAAGMTPAAVVEIDATRRQVAEKEFPGIATFATTEEMLKKSDAGLVIIITPHNTHAKIAMQCLKAGKAVVCEKPFAIRTAECDAMITEAKKRKLTLSTYHNRHWDGSIIHAVNTVRSGKIGEIVRIEAHGAGWGKPGDWWRTSKSISGGILYDWGVHFMEYCLQLLGDAKMREITGVAKNGFWAPHTKWKNDTNEDEVFGLVRFDTGQWLTLNISQIDSKPKDGMLEITGTKGTYVMEYNTWKTITHGKDGSTITETGKNPPCEYEKFYANIADNILGKKPLIITPEWARRTIQIIELTIKSAKLGKALAAKYN